MKLPTAHSTTSRSRGRLTAAAAAAARSSRREAFFLGTRLATSLAASACTEPALARWCSSPACSCSAEKSAEPAAAVTVSSARLGRQLGTKRAAGREAVARSMGVAILRRRDRVRAVGSGGPPMGARAGAAPARLGLWERCGA